MRLEIDGLDEFMTSIQKAIDGELKDQMELWLDAMGMEFLDLIQDEVMRTETVDTRRLLNSFEKGDRDNFWSVSDGGLTLDVGTNLEYASFANDGHFTINPSKGLDRRWVPGYWRGDRFVYSPGSDTGMLLKLTWVDGTGYWDSALAIFQKVFDKSLERRLQEWLDATF